MHDFHECFRILYSSVYSFFLLHNYSQRHIWLSLSNKFWEYIVCRFIFDMDGNHENIDMIACVTYSHIQRNNMANERKRERERERRENKNDTKTD